METTDRQVTKITQTSSLWSVLLSAPEGTYINVFIRNRTQPSSGVLLGVIKDAVVIAKDGHNGPTLISLNAIDEVEIKE